MSGLLSLIAVMPAALHVSPMPLLPAVPAAKVWKRPVSVLVLIHTPDLQFLLLERVANPGYWQSVTGSQEADEPLLHTARREVQEETGMDCQMNPATLILRDWHYSTTYEIFTEWRHRYAPGVTHNTEHWFSLQVPAVQAVQLAPREHRDYCWLPAVAAAERCFSDSNREAILRLAAGG